MNCCCDYGAAVSGEWPEFQKPCCRVHTDPIMCDIPGKPEEMCKRHRAEMDNCCFCHPRDLGRRKLCRYHENILDRLSR
jgi:hypothetical protein